MIYTQQVTLNADGVASVTLGGDAYEKGEDGLRAQLGYQMPPRNGVIWCSSHDERIFSVVASVTGYDNHVISNFALPGHAIIELPCTLQLRGEPGTQVYVQTWKISETGDDRGARQTVVRADENISAPVPDWANSFDFSGSSDSAIATFRDLSSAIVGVAYGRHIYRAFSVPATARTVELSGAAGHLTFRQQG